MRLHVLTSAIGRHHMGQRAQRQHVVDGQLLAGELLGRGPHADHGIWKIQKTLEPSELTQSEPGY